MPRIWCPQAPRATTEPHPLHNAPMTPKPLQFLLLMPLAFGPVAPRLFLGLFALGLVGAMGSVRRVVRAQPVFQRVINARLPALASGPKSGRNLGR